MDKEQRKEMQEIHCMPVNDCVEHIESSECVCAPVHSAKNKWDIKEGKADKEVWVHNCVWIERQ